MPSLSPPLTSTDASIIATKPYQNNSYPQNQLSNPRPWALQRFSPSSRWRLSLLHSVSDQTFMAEKLSDDSILSVNPKPSKCFSSKLIDLLELLVVKLMHDASLPLRYLSGNFAPLRDETPPVKDLPVHGFLPECLNGIFRRVGPNPKFDPLAGYHWHVLFFPCLMEMGRLCLTPSSLMFSIHFSPISTLTHRNGLEGGLGSQMIHGVRIKDGKATYVSRFVKTSRLQQEEFFGDAKLMKIGDLKGFFGLVMVIMQQLRIKLKVLDDSYGNGTANTSLIYHHGKLLALQETDKPYVIKVLEDGDLQTLGMTEYDKRLTHSFTAHPKVDPVTGKSSIFPEKHDIVFLLTHDVPYLFTGEMFTFGCSPMPPYLTYRVISKDGIMHDPVPITISKPIMMHDFAITENYAIFMDLPMHFRPKEMVKEKKMIYSFDPTKKARFGIQVYIGLRAALSLCSSLTGSIPGIGVMFVYLSSWWQVEEKLIFIFSLMNMDVAGYDFSLVPRLNQSSFLILPPIWSELEEQASLVLQGSSSHRMLFSAYVWFDQKKKKKKKKRYVYGYGTVLDGIPRVKGIIKFDLHAEAETGKTKLRVGGNIKGIYEMGQGTYGSDAIYVPGATAEEDDGYLIFYAHDENTGKSCVNVIDAKTMSSEPVAVVELPHRVPYGFHALFVTEVLLR
ncbi:hypothetical protein Bca4012_096078 [Brassica carinata]